MSVLALLPNGSLAMSKHLTHYSLMNANLSKTCTKYFAKQLSNLHDFGLPVQELRHQISDYEIAHESISITLQ